MKFSCFIYSGQKFKFLKMRMLKDVFFNEDLNFWSKLFRNYVVFEAVNF